MCDACGVCVGGGGGNFIYILLVTELMRLKVTATVLCTQISPFLHIFCRIVPLSRKSFWTKFRTRLLVCFTTSYKNTVT